MKMNIRKATVADSQKVAVLFDTYRQFYEQSSDLTLAKNFIETRLKNNESIIFIVEDDHKNPIGFCQIYPTFCSVIAQPIYILSDLFVDPGSRKSGAGKMLLEAAHQHAQQHNIARLDLTTAKDNRVAQSLYESLGWIKDDIFYAYNKTV